MNESLNMISRSTDIQQDDGAVSSRGGTSPTIPTQDHFELETINSCRLHRV